MSEGSSKRWAAYSTKLGAGARSRLPVAKRPASKPPATVSLVSNLPPVTSSTLRGSGAPDALTHTSLYPSPSDSPALARSSKPKQRYAQLPSPLFHHRPSVLTNLVSTTSTLNRSLVPLPLFLPIPAARDPPSRFSGSTGSSRVGSAKKKLEKQRRHARKDAISAGKDTATKIKDLLLRPAAQGEKAAPSSLRRLFGVRKDKHVVHPPEAALSAGRSVKTLSFTPSSTKPASVSAASVRKAPGTFLRAIGRAVSVRRNERERHATQESILGDGDESVAVVAMAEKRLVGQVSDPSLEASRRPSRIPISAIFPRHSHASHQTASPARSAVSESPASPRVQPRRRSKNPRDTNFLLPPSRSRPASSAKSSASSTASSKSASNAREELLLPGPIEHSPSSMGRRRVARGPEELGVGRGGTTGCRETMQATSDFHNLVTRNRFSRTDDESTGVLSRTDEGEGPSSGESTYSLPLRYLQSAISGDSISSGYTSSALSAGHDMPDDLRRLIESVDAHISNNVAPSPTTSSFEGRFTTATAAIRNMLAATVSPLRRRVHEGSIGLRESVQERPSVTGERMMDRIDAAVSLVSLLDPDSPLALSPGSLSRPMRATHSPDDSSPVSFDSSPCPRPADAMRQSLVRYSQDRLAPESQRLSSAFDDSLDPDSEEDMISDDDAASSTGVLSISSSVNGSPCPLPAERHVKMLVSSREKPIGDGRPLFNLPNAHVGRSSPTRGSTTSSNTGDASARSSAVVSERGLSTTPLPSPALSVGTLPSSVGQRRSAVLDISESMRHRSLSDDVVSSIVQYPRPSSRVERLESILESPIKGTEPPILEFSLDQALGYFGEDDGSILDEDSYWLEDRSYTEYEKFGKESFRIIESSVWDWPSTEFATEYLRDFVPPQGTYEILEFIFTSQRRFRSLVSASLGIALTPVPSPTRMLPPPIGRFGYHASSPDVPVSVGNSPIFLPLPLAKTKTLAPLRKPLASKSVNRPTQLAVATKVGPSPFTALPTRISTRLKVLHDPSATHDEPSPSKKNVDVSFLGGKSGVSRRRMQEFDAARRKLEGSGTAKDQAQRSDGESDVELVGEGSGSAAEVSFVKTPRLMASKNRRRAGILSMR